MAAPADRLRFEPEYSVPPNPVCQRFSVRHWPYVFVVLIMQLYLLYPAIVKLYNSFASKKNGPLYVLLFLLAAQLGLTPSSTLRVDAISLAFLVGLFYFVLGFFVVEHYSTLRQQIENLSLTLTSLLVLFSTLCFADLSYHVLLLPDPAAYYLWLDEILTRCIACFSSFSSFELLSHGASLTILSHVL